MGRKLRFLVWVAARVSYLVFLCDYLFIPKLFVVVLLLGVVSCRLGTVCVRNPPIADGEAEVDFGKCRFRREFSERGIRGPRSGD